LDFFDSVRLWDVNSGTLVNSFRVAGTASHVAVSPDCAMVACPVGGFIPGKIVLQVWDTETGKSVAFEDVLDVFSTLWSIGHKPHVCFSPDSKLVAMCLDNHVHVWSTETKKRVLHIRDDECKVDKRRGSFDAISFSRDGNRLQCRLNESATGLSASPHRQWRTWDSTSGLAVGTTTKIMPPHASTEELVVRLGDGRAALALLRSERQGVSLTFDKVPRVAEVTHSEATDEGGAPLASSAIVQHEGQLGFLVLDRSKERT
jgi:WD40 repeat protein